MIDTTHPLVTDPTGEPHIEIRDRGQAILWRLARFEVDRGMAGRPDPQDVEIMAELDISHYGSDFGGRRAKSYQAWLRISERRHRKPGDRLGGYAEVIGVGHPAMSVLTAPAPRFSQAKFDAFAKDAITELRRLATDPTADGHERVLEFFHAAANL